MPMPQKPIEKSTDKNVHKLSEVELQKRFISIAYRFNSRAAAQF